MRRFYLYRKKDVTGVSGVGIVAEGVEFGDGTVAMRWITNGVHSTVIHQSIESMLAIHGHGGATVVRWIDRETPEKVR